MNRNKYEIIYSILKDCIERYGRIPLTKTRVLMILGNTSSYKNFMNDNLIDNELLVVDDESGYHVPTYRVGPNFYKFIEIFEKLREIYEFDRKGVRPTFGS